MLSFALHIKQNSSGGGSARVSESLDAGSYALSAGGETILRPIMPSSGGTTHGVLVGSAGSLQFLLKFRSSCATAPQGFFTACVQAAQKLSLLFSNHAQVLLEVGWGECAGSPITSAVASSSTSPYNETWAQIRPMMMASDNGLSANKTAALATIPTDDPTPSGANARYIVAHALARAWGQIAWNQGSWDGQFGLNSGYGMSFEEGVPKPGCYDGFGAILHEMTMNMGRIGNVRYVGSGVDVYGVLDLFRYSAAGVRRLTVGTPAYFSHDSGTTNLGNWYSPDSGRDACDWSDTGGTDCFGDGNYNLWNHFSPTDIFEMACLGWTLTQLGADKCATLGRMIEA